MWGLLLGHGGLDVASLYILAVDPTAQRQGLGTKLLQAFEQRLLQDKALNPKSHDAQGLDPKSHNAKDHDAKSRRILLEVRASNIKARRFYGRHGFLEIARRPHYYQAPQEDALILEKKVFNHL